MIGTILYTLQEKILFRPTVLESNYQFQFQSEFEEINLKSKDGAIINALHFKAENPKGVILYFHGNAGDLSRWGKIAERFLEYNYDIFIMDYRTYGKSRGELSEQALYADAQLCYDYVYKSFPPEKVTVYGRSLGSGIATYLASKHSTNQLILETPYYSILDVAQYRFPMFPVKGMLKYELPTYKFLENVDCPISIFHGTDDYVVPYSSGMKLKDSTDKAIRFITIEGGGHNNLIEFEHYNSGIEKLLN